MADNRRKMVKVFSEIDRRVKISDNRKITWAFLEFA